MRRTAGQSSGVIGSMLSDWRAVRRHRWCLRGGRHRSGRDDSRAASVSRRLRPCRTGRCRASPGSTALFTRPVQPEEVDAAVDEGQGLGEVPVRGDVRVGRTVVPIEEGVAPADLDRRPVTWQNIALADAVQAEPGSVGGYPRVRRLVRGELARCHDQQRGRTLPACPCRPLLGPSRRRARVRSLGSWSSRRDAAMSKPCRADVNVSVIAGTTIALADRDGEGRR